MHDERLGQTFDWSHRAGELEHTGLVIPRAAQGWLDARRGQSPAAIRAELWNAVEVSEKRKDSKVARDCILAAPWELSPAQRRTMNYRVARFLAERHGFAVEFSAHAPHLNASEKHADERNFHTHFLITTRRLEAGGFTEKARELDSPKTSGPHIEAWRSGVQEIVNRALESAGIDERIDMRSNERRGMAREGQTHKGPAATAMERKGFDTDVEAHNATIRQENLEREMEERRERLTDKSNVIDFEAKRQQRDTRRMQGELFRKSLENKDRMPKALQGQRRTEERLKSERIKAEAAEAQRQQAEREATEQRQRAEAAAKAAKQEAERREAARKEAEARRREEEATAREEARKSAIDRQAAENVRSRSRLEALRQRLQGAMERRSTAMPDRGEGMGWWGRITDGVRVGLERLGNLLSSLPGAASPAVRPRGAEAEHSGQALSKPPPARDNHTPERDAEARREQPHRPHQAQAPPLDERDAATLAGLRARRERGTRSRSAGFDRPAPQRPPDPAMDERDRKTLAQLQARRARGQAGRAFERTAEPAPDVIRGQPMPEAQPVNDNAGPQGADAITLAQLRARRERGRGSQGEAFDRAASAPPSPVDTEKSPEERDAEMLAQLRARRERGRTRGPEPPHREPERC